MAKSKAAGNAGLRLVVEISGGVCVGVYVSRGVAVDRVSILDHDDMEGDGLTSDQRRRKAATMTQGLRNVL